MKKTITLPNKSKRWQVKFEVQAIVSFPSYEKMPIQQSKRIRKEIERLLNDYVTDDATIYKVKFILINPLL